MKRRLWIRRACLAGMGTLLAVALFPPIQRFSHASQQSQRVEARLTILKEQHERLSQEVKERQRYCDYLRTPEAREVRARHDGYHLKGEQVYLLLPENP